MNQATSAAAQFNTIYTTLAVFVVLTIAIASTWALWRFGTYKATAEENNRLRKRIEDLEKAQVESSKVASEHQKKNESQISKLETRLETIEAENNRLRHDYQDCYQRLNKALEDVLSKDNKIIYQQDKIHQLEIEKAAAWKPTRRSVDS